jgi:hypothetical protein
MNDDIVDKLRADYLKIQSLINMTGHHYADSDWTEKTIRDNIEKLLILQRQITRRLAREIRLQINFDYY